MSKAYELGLYEKAMPGTLTWKERLEAAKAAGYDYVEISIDATEEKIAWLIWTRQNHAQLENPCIETDFDPDNAVLRTYQICDRKQ